MKFYYLVQFKSPKDDSKYQWTSHVKQKMLYYGISESLVKRIVRVPKRKEEGIAPGTIAVMQPGTSKKNPQEIWVMYVELSKLKDIPDKRKRIISSWRYPGVSKPGTPIPIPDEIRSELEDLENLK